MVIAIEIPAVLWSRGRNDLEKVVDRLVWAFLRVKDVEAAYRHWSGRVWHADKIDSCIVEPGTSLEAHTRGVHLHDFRLYLSGCHVQQEHVPESRYCLRGIDDF